MFRNHHMGLLYYRHMKHITVWKCGTRKPLLIYFFFFTCFFFGPFVCFCLLLRFFFLLFSFTLILGSVSSAGSSVPIMLGTHLFRVKSHICVESCSGTAPAVADAAAAAEGDSDPAGATSGGASGVSVHLRVRVRVRG